MLTISIGGINRKFQTNLKINNIFKFILFGGGTNLKA